MICAVKECARPIYAREFCKRHYTKLRRYGNAEHGKTLERERGTGSITTDGYIEIKRDGISRLAHLLVVEKVLGHALPAKARVHHVNGDRQDNRPENLVVCPDDAYHQLLHRRSRALAESGHADWEKCQYCKKWDDPQFIIVGKRVKFHRKCKNAYESKRTANGY